MSELVKLNDEQNTLATTLDSLAESGLTCRDMKHGFRKALMTASCIKQLGEALTPQVMEPIMALQGSSLGFRTDKDNQGGYPLNVVKEALIAAVMVGLMPCGNHFNVISARMYVTKEGFTYLLDQAGVKYTIDQAVPVMKNGGAIVTTDITWTFEGKEGTKHLEIPVRVNAGMGADAILGKADRKAKCWLYNNLLHAQLSDGDAEGAAPMRNVTPDSASGMKPAASSGLRAAAPAPKVQAAPAATSAGEASVVEAVEVPAEPAQAEAADPAPKRKPDPAAEGAYDRLCADLQNAGKNWRGFAKWMQSEGVRVPEGASRAEFDTFAHWVYSQPDLLEEMVATAWIVKSMC